MNPALVSYTFMPKKYLKISKRYITRDSKIYGQFNTNKNINFQRIYTNKFLNNNISIIDSNCTIFFCNSRSLFSRCFTILSSCNNTITCEKNIFKNKSIKTMSNDNKRNPINDSMNVNDNSQTNNEKNIDSTNYDYDYIVIGGGPGGMASAKEAASHGAKVLLFDFVKPSSQGAKWGIGGTCVNVGCVPKKLMHYAGNMGTLFKNDSEKYGWNFNNLKHDWNTLVGTVQSHIRSLNFSYMVGLKSSKVKYINGLAKLKDKNTVSYHLKGDTSKEECVTGKYILVATGCRPNIPDDVIGAKELSITSDDIFSLKRTPGKTLVVGASYVALECAGFLNSLGCDVTISVRSIILRGFDQQCANKIKLFMEEQGVTFMTGVLPKKLTKENDKILVHFNNDTTETYDTVLYAIGRKGDIDGLNLEKLNININNSNNKIIADQFSCTNIPNIFAVGDIAENVPELAPVAIKAGEILARRLFKNSNEIMKYDFIPTSIYTPIEYGSCGYSEEKAYEKFGKNNIEVFLQEFNNLEISAVHRIKHVKAQKDEYDVDISSTCLSKLVCLKNEDNRVIGFHYVGPNAGEVTQGMALALKLNAKKSDFDNCIGIHPTDAESFMNLTITLSSGLSYAAKGGCGGGKCG
ncbi:thioredoxin reductase, putative [Plasmodium vinckei vinckei]|uniref:Thioredoxin reductase n=1 Tax=Plasmodium vinckei vinckei TaxID=54757 RepID=A0A449BRI4_PLAVN|nr:thioredoxin reductase, putative [Plasmodium vinckei vinckei]KEG01853.1 thioredoxin reductase 2 [Plasmodium vinckei vinckei]VEV56061.1 thioredoxin reductase, putative [Plasmodium vinckei vinckei]